MTAFAHITRVHLLACAVHRRARSDESGFTLIETVVSLVIFAIIAGAALTSVSAGIKTQALTQSRVGASNIAQQTIEQAQANGPSALLSADGAPIGTQDLPTVTTSSATYTAVETVTATSPDKQHACPDSSTRALAATANPPAQPLPIYTLVVHVEVTQTAKTTGPVANTRPVAMDTVIAC